MEPMYVRCEENKTKMTVDYTLFNRFRWMKWTQMVWHCCKKVNSQLKKNKNKLPYANTTVQYSHGHETCCPLKPFLGETKRQSKYWLKKGRMWMSVNRHGKWHHCTTLHRMDFQRCGTKTGRKTIEWVNFHFSFGFCDHSSNVSNFDC